MKKLLFIIMLQISPLSAFDCLNFAHSPTVDIKTPSPNISITQPLKEMDLLHGDVIATFSEKYELSFLVSEVKDGYCVAIDSISANIGYTNFVIEIDKEHVVGSCEFNATREHEEEHISAHLSAIKDSIVDMNNAINGAANSIVPIFVEDKESIDSAMNDMQKDFEENPKLKILRLKINAEQEIRNKKVDLNDKGERIRKCFE